MRTKRPDFPCVLLSRDGSLVSKAICWFTDGRASHARLYFPPLEGVWESQAPKGVQFNRFTDFSNVEIYGVLQGVDWNEVLNFCLDQRNKGYDWLGDFRFITRTSEDLDHKTVTRWNCSGLVFAALKAGGCDLVSRVPFWKVSPEGLRRSPLLLGPIFL